MINTAEEKRKLKEQNLKKKEKNKSKNPNRRCFDESQTKIKNKGKQKKAREPTSESSHDDNSDLSNICDDDELDNIDLSLSSPPFEKAPSKPNEICCICSERGKNNELWFCCALCSTWNHAEYTGVDTAENYVCDYCTEK